MSTPTPIHQYGDWWAKREDLAAYTGDEHPSGAKVRQYLAMIANSPPDAALVVGCSADSAMQIYVAYAAHLTGRDGHVFTAARKKRSHATDLAARYGADIHEISPGYLSLMRIKAKEYGMTLGRPVVRWDLDYAATDTATQVHNLPPETRRVVVPTGSGLTAAAILATLSADTTRSIRVVAVCVSDLADRDKILATAAKRIGTPNPDLLDVIPATSSYGTPEDADLPDGTPLDPYYAAKAYEYIEPGDVLWVSGRRPLI